MLRRVLILIAAVAIPLSLAAGPRTQALAQDVNASAAGALTATVTVSSGSGWQETPVNLIAGDTYTVSYESGSWTVDRRNFSPVGPQGYSSSVDRTIYQGCKYDPDVNYAVLLGQIGGTADFPIRQGGTFTANATGPLSLRINDDDACLGDNGGAVTMYIDHFQNLRSSAGADYAGYSSHPNQGLVSYALATWKVPSVTCASHRLVDKTQLSAWVGLWGGPNTRASVGPNSWLVQTGIVAQCAYLFKSFATYQAVYQIYNPRTASGFRPLFTVHAGDTMFAQVEYVGKTPAGALKFWFDVTDRTTGDQVQQFKYVGPAVDPAHAAFQGGVIVERVEGNDLSGHLPKFSSITFSDVAVGQDSPTTNKWTGYRWIMTGYAQTGPLSISSSGHGVSFDVKWLSAVGP